jgi:hypothetical protein
MSRPIRSTLRRVTPGVEIVPPSLLVLLDHPWIGAASLVVALGFTTLHSRMLLRAEEKQKEALLTYAHTTTTVGGDPHRVIAALSRDTTSIEVPPPRTYRPRGYDESRKRSVVS